MRHLKKLAPRKPKPSMTADGIAATVELYLQHCARTPIPTEKLFHNRGEVIRATVEKHHLPTIAGLAVMLGTTTLKLRQIQADRANQRRLANAIDAAHDALAAYISGLAGADAVNANIAGRALDHVGMAAKIEALPPSEVTDGVSRMTNAELQLLAAAGRVNKRGGLDGE